MCRSTQSHRRARCEPTRAATASAILKAARAVFSARGRDAHLDDVARRAKVGMGTVYRHFPTKEALLEALAREQFELLTGVGARGAGRARRLGGARGAAVARRRAPGLRPRADGGGRRVQAERRRQAEELQRVHRSPGQRARKAEGTVRADATGDDVRLMMCGLGSVMQMGGDGWRRYLTVMLDGLRAEPGSLSAHERR